VFVEDHSGQTRAKVPRSEVDIDVERKRIDKAREDVKKLRGKGSSGQSSMFGFNPFLDRNNMFPELREGYPSRVKGKGMKRVAYFTNMLLDWHDHQPRYGGGERYALNLATLLKDHGFEVDFYQVAAEPFEGEYYGFPVKAIKIGKGYSEFQLGAVEEFYQISLDYDCVIYNLPEYSSGRMRTDAIMICHGIWFDHNNYPWFKFRQNEWFNYLNHAFKNPHKIVSVDTNSINVIRCLWPELTKKMRFIPNFVDHRAFHPPTKRVSDRLTVIFPRRSQINRGSRLLADILREVPHDVDFYWIGRGDKYDTELIERLCKIDPRLHFEEVPFEDMAEWYRKADIVVIPTIACEGTSLSCIEAMASGCATISTNVGGLPDFIQDGYNGRLVEPEAMEIADAINELICNEGLRNKLAQNGYETSMSFTLPKWQEKWLHVLREEGWIEMEQSGKACFGNGDRSEPKIAIVTRNAYHGGVESLIKIEAERLSAKVVVTGGLNDPLKTCPFPFTYASSYDELRDAIDPFDFVLYHYPFPWAVQAIGDSCIPSMEFVHRSDTSELDKQAPTMVVTHSDYLCDFIKETYKVDCRVIPNVVDTTHYHPGVKSNKEKKIIGVVTQLYKIKGIDVLLEGWAQIHKRFPQYRLGIYGTGEQEPHLKKMAKSLGIDVYFHGVVADPAKIYQDELGLYITSSHLEGFPIAILEALACNVPVLASDIEGHIAVNRMAAKGGHADLLLLFKEGSADDLADKLGKYLENGLRESTTYDVISTLFSPEKHTDLIMRYAKETIELQKTEGCASVGKFKELVNTGQYSSTPDQDGFEHMGLAKAQVNLDGNIVLTNEAYIGHLCRIPDGASRICYAIEMRSEASQPVFIQFDWLDIEGKAVRLEGKGKRPNPVGVLSDIERIPEDLRHRIVRFRLVIRPNKADSAEISKLTIGLW
jgi:glycosyltransferase involved in cell wall biosynthesis